MAWIKVINKDEATGELKDLYDHVLEKDDDIDNEVKLLLKILLKNMYSLTK